MAPVSDKITEPCHCHHAHSPECLECYRHHRSLPGRKSFCHQDVGGKTNALSRRHNKENPMYSGGKWWLEEKQRQKKTGTETGTEIRGREIESVPTSLCTFFSTVNKEKDQWLWFSQSINTHIHTHTCTHTHTHTCTHTHTLSER